MQHLYGALKEVWNFIFSFIRLILFLLCSLFVIIQLVWLGIVIYGKDRIGLALPASDLNYMVFLHVTVLICTGLLGCWATFFNSDRAAKYFAALITICAIFLIVLTATTLPELPELKKGGGTDYLRMLKDKAKYYDWKQDGRADDRSKEATRIWDSLQNLHCCGIYNSSDWDQFRPSDIDKRYFPRTCCFPGSEDKVSGLCPTQTTFWHGCYGRVRDLEYIKKMFYVGFSLLSVLLSISSCIYVFGKV